MFSLLIWKRRLESLLMSPLVALGWLAAQCVPWKRTYRIIYFFPFYHTGGAEKIHAQIAAATGGPDCLIIFTRKSVNERFRSAFNESGSRILDLSRYTGTKWLYPINFFFRGFVAAQINRMAQTPVLFNGHSNFAYKLSPWLRRQIRQLDLVHSLNSFSRIRVPYAPFYAQSIQISKVKLEAHRALYHKLHVPQNLIERLLYIPNAVPFPERDITVKPEERFTVLFNGRHSPEKRFPLFVRVAAEVKAKEWPVRFRAIGVSPDEAGPKANALVECLGSLTDPARIHNLFFESQVLLLTSSTEGFPLVVIEAMANGCAILATPVGDLPLHITNDVNGYLFSTIDDENQIIEEAVAAIGKLLKHTELCQQMARSNRTYAEANFSMSAFNEAYRRLLHQQNAFRA
ncbi:glycosyltransferase family 4 protein [Flaviaesturariibacter terrae]